MSEATVDLIMRRIKAATKESPIAVFRMSNGELDAVFASTIHTMNRMRQTTNLVGIYYRPEKEEKLEVELDDIEFELRIVYEDGMRLRRDKQPI
jgi:hypothetical protein